MTPEPTAAATRPERAQPETLRLRTITPMFTVNDIQASLAWYRDVLSFTVADEWKADDGALMGVGLVAGTCRVNLVQDDFKKGRDRNKGVGHRVLCETAQDVDELAGEIEARGGTLDAPPSDTPWGARTLAVTDPDGFKLTIFRQTPSA